VQDARPFRGVDETEIHYDVVESAASECENSQQGFQRDGLALLGA
jgi:hypothetical protein